MIRYMGAVHIVQCLVGEYLTKSSYLKLVSSNRQLRKTKEMFILFICLEMRHLYFKLLLNEVHWQSLFCSEKIEMERKKRNKMIR